ncbi:hypothetical protein CLV33_107232 [Jejuia pallidilutea]|uniref:Uncharacterized protein n=1 Tax=Jejuia pallidilutea TaxID=504487 RepID=A0A362WZ37_9FLAO|nr:hypothetical protein [Jejuia pallidilutea]PQV47443.1 hypothetical protein CLV33_107232 [Jejuia pallidilutea]
MLNGLKTYLLYGTIFCGVEHTLKDNQSILFVTTLRKTKKQLSIENTFEVDSPKKLAQKLPKKNLSIFLVINDNNILTKKIEDTQPNLENLVYNAFPNLNIKDFYYEIVSQDNMHFVSICRKVHLETLIAAYKEAGVSIINISLGQNIITNSLSFISSESIFTSNALVVLKNKSLVSIEKKEIETPINYDVNGLKTTNNYVLSLSGALETVIHNYKSYSSFNSINESLKNEYSQSRFFQQFIKAGLVFTLSVLLINFFVFNHYFNHVNTLQQTSQVNQNSKAQLLTLNETVNKSQKMVDDMLKSSVSNSSFFINVIVGSLPESVSLSELNYQPISKRIKEGQSILQDTNVILLSGSSNSSEVFSKWITRVEAIGWVNNVEILNYEDTSKSISNFSLKLNIADDQ